MVSQYAGGTGSIVSGLEFAATLMPGPEALPEDVTTVQASLLSAVASGQSVDSLVGAALLDPQQLSSPLVEKNASGLNRTFLSGLPATFVNDGGVPEWAHGMRVQAISPALITVDGLPAQMHRIVPFVQMTLVRAGDPTIIISFPLPRFSPKGHSIQIEAGSVWLAAGLITSEATGGFAGLRVKGGVLKTDSHLTIHGLQVVLPAHASATLILELDQSPEPSAAAGPSDNRVSVRARVPNSVALHIAPGGVALTTNDGATLDIHGVSVQLTPETAPVSYDNLTRDLTLPLIADVATWDSVVSDSDLAKTEGVVPIKGAVWTIPVAFTAPENLGQALGTGAIRFFLGSGLTVDIPSLNLTIQLRQATLSIGSGLLELTGEVGVRLATRLLLWNERPTPGAPPKDSSILFSAMPGGKFLLRESSLAKVVALFGSCAASIDRPVAGGSKRLGLTLPTAALVLNRSSAGLQAYVIGNSPSASPPIAQTSIVLENGLLVVGAARTLVASGRLMASRIESGTLRVTLPLLGIVPILPDPYAANFLGPELVDDVPSGHFLTFAVKWESPDRATLDISTLAQGVRSPDRGPLSLLDVSTNADLLGVELSGASAEQIDDSILKASGLSMAVFTVPGLSWEPVEFDSPTTVIDLPANDGERTVVRAAAVRLVPLEPAPLLREFINAAQSGAAAEMRFMLPFGLFANANLPDGAVTDLGASFELVTPEFLQGLQGGYQLTLRPPNPGVSTRGFPGSVVALSNGAKEILGFDPTNPGAGDVWSLFDGEFGPGGVGPNGSGPIVPVTRVDLSGYGTSMFSDWINTGEVTGVSEARFDALVGRVSYEVIQVASVLQPWGIRVVRTITMARQAGGRLLRSDTGWLAFSDGRFDIPTGVVAHKGPVVRVTNVHNIKDQSEELTLDPGTPGLDFQTVSFDADVELSPDLHVPDGGVNSGSGTLVPSLGLNGYLQRRPIGKISIPQLGLLMQGPPGRTAGGPMACTVDLGGTGTPGPLVRVTGIRVSATDSASTPELIVSLLGMPRLPSNGSWSIGQLTQGAREPAALGPMESVPLVRPNASPDWHFADPSDINRLNAPQAMQYGLLQATGTQRAFFRQPRVPVGSSQINLAEPPHLADVASLLNATGVFPDLQNTLRFDQSPQMTAVGDTLTVQHRQFSLAGIPPRTLLELPPVKVLLAYADADGSPAVVTVEINPAGSPSWVIDISTVSLLLIIPPFGTDDDPLLRLTGSIHADSLTAPTYNDLVVHFGGAMSLVEQVFSRLQELAKLLPGGSARLDVSFADGRLTIRDGFTLPNLPLGLGQITDIGMDLGLTVALSPPSVDFQVGIASPEKPFHWLVSPLSGTGTVVVGSTDGRPTILIQGGIGAGLAIDLGIASGSASVVIALQVDNRVSPLELKFILTGQAAVDVLEGLASVSLMLSAAMGIIPDKLPIPHEIILFAEVAVGIHIAVCWIASIDFDGSWHVQQTLTSPIS